MPSTYTTRNRAEKQATGENLDSWGSRLNGNTIDMFDQALDGVLSLTVSGSVTLSTANGSSDQARYRCLNITGTGGTVTIPNLEKCYLVRNASSGTVTFTTGSGTIAAVLAGTSTWVFSTGANAVYAIQIADFGSAGVATSGTIKSSGPTSGIGYATGAGGTVTQPTSKSTGVSLDKICGQITMNNAALAGGATVSFYFTNSNFSTTDMFMVTPFAGAHNYQVWVDSFSAGTIGISVKNITGGSLSDALVLNFMILKGVIA